MLRPCRNLKNRQPPLRGCVLKQREKDLSRVGMLAAASARLCVETGNAKSPPCDPVQPPLRGCVLKLSLILYGFSIESAAASARLCVETPLAIAAIAAILQPPLRGCVLKPTLSHVSLLITSSSRLCAAVC